jgi:hypothetical protein
MLRGQPERGLRRTEPGRPPAEHYGVASADALSQIEAFYIGQARRVLGETPQPAMAAESKRCVQIRPPGNVCR